MGNIKRRRDQHGRIVDDGGLCMCPPNGWSCALCTGQGSGELVPAEQFRGAVEAGDALADAVRALDSYAASSQVAPLERSERATKALRAWDTVRGY